MTASRRLQSLAVKRVADVVLSAIALALLLVPMIGIALAVRVSCGTPVIFRQTRPGRYGHPFQMYKFRTMTDDTDELGNILPDRLRITRVGAFLRATSLDELPELWNVIKGDMSLVGPRPLLMRYLPYYTQRELRRHEMPPGVTGWAQIHGRNTVGWDERLALDVWYVEHWSLRLDRRILLKTLSAVLFREGVAVDPDSLETNLDEERRSRAQRAA